MSPSDPAQTAVSGAVVVGAPVSELVWTRTAQSGPCRLEEPRAPFCNPSCGDGVCVEDNRCAAYPRKRNVGRVRLSGLATLAGPAPIELVTFPPGYVYDLPVEPAIAFPPFAPGAPLKVSAEGGEGEPFEVTARGISPLELTGADPIAVVGGQPTSLGWRPAAAAESTSIEVHLDISHHGGTKGIITCSAPDDGSLEIPAPLITKLVNLGVSGYPSVRITRRSSGSTAVKGGAIVLEVLSEVVRAVSIPGLVSCDADADCPGGGRCAVDKKCV
jgi:hypothetical protein